MQKDPRLRFADMCFFVFLILAKAVNCMETLDRDCFLTGCDDGLIRLMQVCMRARARAHFIALALGLKPYVTHLVPIWQSFLLFSFPSSLPSLSFLAPIPPPAFSLRACVYVKVWKRVSEHSSIFEYPDFQTQARDKPLEVCACTKRISICGIENIGPSTNYS